MARVGPQRHRNKQTISGSILKNNLFPCSDFIYQMCLLYWLKANSEIGNKSLNFLFVKTKIEVKIFSVAILQLCVP